MRKREWERVGLIEEEKGTGEDKDCYIEKHVSVCGLARVGNSSICLLDN